jgi:hypothetical protein
MCDYSLYTIPNRLAEEGEELVLRKFETGTIGFAPLSDVISLESPTTTKTGGFWSMLKDFVSPPRPPKLMAVCIAPGARLLVTGVPGTFRHLCASAAPKQWSSQNFPSELTRIATRSCFGTARACFFRICPKAFTQSYCLPRQSLGQRRDKKNLSMRPLSNLRRVQDFNENVLS